jgi:hypothetical protein
LGRGVCCRGGGAYSLLLITLAKQKNVVLFRLLSKGESKKRDKKSLFRVKKMKKKSFFGSAFLCKCKINQIMLIPRGFLTGRNIEVSLTGNSNKKI